MRKLRLQLDTLSVESFATQETEMGKGTVAARQAASTLYFEPFSCGSSCQYTCDDPTCPACPTCAVSCNGTCDATCDETCGVSCWDTCRPRLCGPDYTVP